MVWGWTDLGDRIRTGEVVTDLLRPVHPVAAYLAIDLGRAAVGLLTRFLVADAGRRDLLSPVRAPGPRDLSTAGGLDAVRSLADRVGLVAGQLAWAVATVALAALVQRRAERKPRLYAARLYAAPAPGPRPPSG